LLTVIWGQTFCSHMNCAIEPLHHFTIHGLWPTTAYPPYPEYCNPDLIYDPDIIKPLEPELEIFWPFYFQDFHSFWKYEWDKHGTCSVCIPEVRDQYQYFEHSLFLYYRYEHFAILFRNSIYPGYTYNKTDFEDALGPAYYMQCYGDKLQEIGISFNETWDLIPSPIDHHCPDVIDFYHPRNTL